MSVCVFMTALGTGCSRQMPRPELHHTVHGLETSATAVQADATEQEVSAPVALMVAPENTSPHFLGRVSTPPSNAKNLWESLAKSLTFDGATLPEVRRELDWYRGQGPFLRETSARAAPYLHFITTEVARRNLPADLALLPILESGYKPSVISPFGAAGLWQFMGGTGSKFGLQRSAWLDERLDIVASTEAALEYLTTLQRRFDGDWLLAIAAYNAGWGNVERAIARNRRAGLSTDIWSLKLTGETHKLVARLLALVEIYRHPAKFDLALETVPDRAFFSALVLRKPTDLRRLTQLAKIDPDTFRTLNPGFLSWHTGPTTAQRVLVPATSAEAATRISARLGASPPTAGALIATTVPTRRPASTRTYVAKRGDSLWVIARRFDTRVPELERINSLSRNHPVRIGQRITVPTSTHSPDAADDNSSVVRYRVRQGDSLWTISRLFKVSIKELLAWNKLATHGTLRPGQELLVRRDLSALGARQAPKSS